MSGAGDRSLEVVLALPGRCWRVHVDAASQTTTAEIVARSGLADVCRRETGEVPVPGIYGRKVEPDHVPVDGERIELYRGLTADPRARRQARVASARGSGSR